MSSALAQTRRRISEEAHNCGMRFRCLSLLIAVCLVVPTLASARPLTCQTHACKAHKKPAVSPKHKVAKPKHKPKHKHPAKPVTPAPGTGGSGQSAVLANTTAPMLSGSSAVGGTLTCDSGQWQGTVTLAYRWERGLDSATNVVSSGFLLPSGGINDYIVQPADLGYELRCVVTGSRADGKSLAVSTDPVTVIPRPVVPENTSAPTLTGDPALGATLTCDSGQWQGAARISYRWERGLYTAPNTFGGNAAFAGPSFLQGGSTYIVQPSDVGYAIRCVVVGSSESGKSVSVSTPAVIPPPVPEKAPTMQDPDPSDSTGQRLFTCVSAWNGSLGWVDQNSLSYAWLRDGAVIPNQTNGYYTTTSDDVGHELSCEVTAIVQPEAGASWPGMPASAPVSVLSAPVLITIPAQ